MKYIKENMTLVIVGVVVLLLVVAAFGYPLPQWRGDLRSRMEERRNDGETIKSMESKDLPLGPIKGKGVPTAEWIAAKKKLIEKIYAARDEVTKEASRNNAHNRVDANGLPLLPVPLNATLSQVGMPLKNTLPKVSISEAMDFKQRYQALFRIWTNVLVAGTFQDTGPAPSTPPRLDDLQRIYTDDMTRAAALLPGAATAPGAMANVAQAQLTSSGFYKYAKDAVKARAAGLQMYVEPAPLGFQIRDWAYPGHDAAPDEQRVFEGLVDCWIQADIVKAIVQVNNPLLGAGLDRNVGKAAVKRLTRIIIGNNARNRQLGTGTPGAAVGGVPISGGAAGPSDPGTLFYNNNPANSNSGGGGVPINAGTGGGTAQAYQSVANAINYETGLTGRSGGDVYDVVHVSILMDIDPAYLNAFEKALYSQNMGYTVEWEQTHTVDPTDRASNGYLYGGGQVVEAEIELEVLFLRDWTAALMPDDVLKITGAKKPEPKKGN